MNYDTALKLKDAGFPQYIRGITGLIKDPTCAETFSMHQNVDGSFDLDKPREEVLKYYAYEPTLSELIQACGDGFESLERGWLAKATGGRKIDWEFHSDPYEHHEGKGQTPEIAVANLWLALNKK